MKRTAGFAIAAALLLCLDVVALAEKNGEGDLVVAFNADLRPTVLPRQTPVPVAVRVAGDVKLLSGGTDRLPQLQTISVAINRQGRLYDRGLPVCNVEQIQPATETTARRICGDAMVGSGHVVLEARIPTQSPFTVRARLLVFNGPRRNGHKLILAQAYAQRPPGAFVLTFRVSHGSGVFGTVMSTTLPPGAREWAYLTHFDMTLHRIYTYRGVRRSYISAACTAPPGFDRALFPLARATYRFADALSLATTVARSCHVAEGPPADRAG